MLLSRMDGIFLLAGLKQYAEGACSAQHETIKQRGAYCVRRIIVQSGATVLAHRRGGSAVPRQH